jgi:hypothetical protein
MTEKSKTLAWFEGYRDLWRIRFEQASETEREKIEFAYSTICSDLQAMAFIAGEAAETQLAIA